MKKRPLFILLIAMSCWGAFAQKSSFSLAGDSQYKPQSVTVQYRLKAGSFVTAKKMVLAK